MESHLYNEANMSYTVREPGLHLAHSEPEPCVLLIQLSSITRHQGEGVGEEMMMMRMSGQKSGRGQILSMSMACVSVLAIHCLCLHA